MYKVITMKTERYIVSFFGIDTKYYTDEYVSHLWEQYADNEYQESRNYITGLIDRRSLVCGKIRGCELTDYAHVISTVRNPIEIGEKDIFMKSLKNILRNMREILGNPSMTLSVQDIEFYYFT